MASQPISDEVAVRIALAARVLPDVSVRDLIEVLQTYLDDEISEESLSTITVTQLKRALGNIYEVDEGEWEGEDANNQDISAFKEAVRILWGEMDLCDQSLPVEPDGDDMPNSIRIAVASNVGEQLDGHFGSCQRYLIYQLSADRIKLIDVRSALAADLSDNKNQFRVDLIRDCPVLYVTSIGGPAAAKVIQANIYPMKVAAGGPIREQLADLQQAIATSPPPWLAKILGLSAEQRVKNYSGVSDN